MPNRPARQRAGPSGSRFLRSFLQTKSLDFAGGGFRDLRDPLECDWKLIDFQLGAQALQDLLVGELAVRDDEGLHDLTHHAVRVGDTHAGAFDDARDLVQDLLHLHRGHFLAADVDHFLDPALEVDVSPVVLDAAVSRAEVAVVEVGGEALGGLVPIAAGDVVPLHADFAFLPVRELLPFGREDLDLTVGRGVAGREEVVLAGVELHERAPGCFRGAVVHADPRVREQFHQQFLVRRGHERAADLDVSELVRKLADVLAAHLLDEAPAGRDHAEARHAATLHLGEELLHVCERAEHHQRPALRQHAFHPAQAEGMADGERQQFDVLGGIPNEGVDVLGRGRNVFVRQGDALRRAGRARGEQDVGDVPHRGGRKRNGLSPVSHRLKRDGLPVHLVQGAQDSHRLRGGEDVVEARLVRVRVDRHTDAAGQVHAEVGVHELDVARRGEDHAIPALDAQLGAQAPGGLETMLPQLPVGHFRLARDQRGLVGKCPGIPEQLFLDGDHLLLGLNRLDDVVHVLDLHHLLGLEADVKRFLHRIEDGQMAHRIPCREIADGAVGIHFTRVHAARLGNDSNHFL